MISDISHYFEHIIYFIVKIAEIPSNELIKEEIELVIELSFSKATCSLPAEMQRFLFEYMQ